MNSVLEEIGLTDVMNLQNFRTRADVFSVGGIQEKFIEMTTKYNQDDYGDAVAMARRWLNTCTIPSQIERLR